MKGLRNKIFLSLTLIATTLSLTTSASAYVVEKNLIGTGNPSGAYSTSKFVILHEAGNPNNVGANSLDNEVNYMRNNWWNAYTSHFVGSGGRVVQLANVGTFQYGAGSWGNTNAYAQIELARTNNKNTFIKDYVSYVNLARDLALEKGLSLNLDSNLNNGIITHKYISDNVWGDHQDPYAYLASFGISKSKLASDLKTGTSISAINAYLNGSASNNSSSNTNNNNNSGNTTNKSFKWVFKYDTNIRNKAGLSGTVVGMYKVGQSVNINSTTVKDGYTWGNYTSYSGQARSVALIGYNPTSSSTNTTNKSGYYTVKYNTNIRNSASTNSAVVGTYYAGQGFYYDKIVTAGGYKWASYISYSGIRRYVAMIN